MFVHRGGSADTEEGGRRGRGRVGGVLLLLLLLEVPAATNEADDAPAAAKAAKTSRHRDLKIVILFSLHFHPFVLPPPTTLLVLSCPCLSSFTVVSYSLLHIMYFYRIN